ncbi:SDR family NAD(P)-dependent oxidoreductase [Nocardia sp. NBC_00565]|uniref:SDR family NAD(P)-dependent oxidoreductase n=1 Tax=Nocardia sp. NBC_00565 TaxID=2975993 RepID=UPI002E8037B2|nr:SDR family NAD(P)-dependent oxidoreductase [Nocardia sp. NBC_00565]WUC02189.1 SDR family NAD(P)-dependent oxidoreductase [Nocardia sp. NBC_00565]
MTTADAASDCSQIARNHTASDCSQVARNNTDSVRPYPPVSIIGIGCRVPGATGVPEFWRMLLDGRDATGAPPPGRLGARHGGYLADVDAFDNDWFAISGREAALMDPQQRLALEVAVEALDDAGIGHRTRGSGAAVVFGASTYDHGITVLGGGGHDAPYAVTGSALSIIANRLSYVLDLHGPSLVVDSACSSSLAAVDLALRLLADDAVPFAIVGGVNLTLLPHIADYLAEGGFLAPDGRCKPFDAEADGYTRSDGCTVVVLQRTADAQRDGSRVYAEILGTAVGSDGRSNGLYAPNGRAQQDAIRTAWTRAERDPRSAGYIECHGTGTPLGDAVEVGALAAVLGDGVEPTWIGSVKSNLGHLEAAAGITGLVKAALSIRHGVIAATINFHIENPLLRLAEHGLRVPTEPVDWTGTPVGARLAGVSSFGFGGTNAHVVLGGIAPPRWQRGFAPPVVIPVTGRDIAEVRARARRWAEELDSASSVRLTTVDPHTAANGSSSQAETNDREQLRQFASAIARLIPENARAAVLVHDRGDAVERLRALADGVSGAGVIGASSVRRRGGMLFLFSGQGGQHPKMGRALAARYPVFANAVTAATDALVAAGGTRVWTPRNGFALGGSAAGNGTSTTELVQPAIFAFQVALAELLGSWGVAPDAVAGHSLGEVAAAAVSGALSLSDAARVAVRRSRILAQLDGRGAMAVLEAAPDEAARLVEPLHAAVGIAAINGPRSVVISGAARYIDALIRRAKRRQIFAQRIAVDFAAHSPQVRELLPEFVDTLDDLTARVPRVPVYSTARRGETITTAAMDAGYWAENASGTVELAAALERAAGDGFSSVLEIAPHPVLIPAVREYPDFADAAHAVTSRDDEAGAFSTCLGRLYVEGRVVNWAESGPFAAPPPREWSRRRFPLVTSPDSGSVPVDHRPTAAGVIGTESDLPADDLADHVVQGEPIVPAVFWLRRLLGLAEHTSATMITDFVVHKRTDLPALSAVTYRNIGGGKLQAEVTGAGTLASARLAGDPTPADIVAWMRVVDANRAARRRMRTIATGDFYASLRARHLEYGPDFRVLRGIEAGSDCAVGSFDSASPQRSATLDGCLHLLAAANYDHLPADAVPLPIGIESAWLSAESEPVLLEAHAFVRDRSVSGLTGDIIGTDQHGVPVLALTGVQIRFTTSRACPEAAVPVGPFRHEMWVPLQHRTGRDGAHTADPQRALVIGESQLAVRLARELDRTLPTERVAREPDAAGPIVAAVLAARSGRTAIVVVWPTESASGGEIGTDSIAATGRVLDLIQRVQSEDATASLTIVLPDYPPDHRHSGTTTQPPPAAVTVPMAVAGLVRSLQLESGRDIRLIWTDGAETAVPRLRELIVEPSVHALPEELRIRADIVAARRFVPVRPRITPTVIDPNGTYVVTGGLGALGSVAVRWLLDAGARDVVVLTRAPRPVPALLDGLEDRIVVVRCDAADRNDLANALNDIRECGSTIRGVVHAAGALEDAAFDAITARQLTRMFAPKLIAAGNVIELTAADPTDFALLFSSATGALGAPGQAAYASANAAMDALAHAHPGRRVLSIGWGVWDSGLADGAGGAVHLRRAGIAAFDASRGTELLAQTMRYDERYLLALDYTPTANPTPVAIRLRTLLTTDDPAKTASAPPSPAVPRHHRAEPLTTTIRAVLAATLDLSSEHLDPEADFNDLGLSSLLGIEMRRHLESRLNIRISTAELFEHPTITALGAALADRVAAKSDEAL